MRVGQVIMKTRTVIRIRPVQDALLVSIKIKTVKRRVSLVVRVGIKAVPVKRDVIIVLLASIKTRTRERGASLVVGVNIKTRTDKAVASLAHQVTTKVEMEVRAVLLVVSVSIKIHTLNLAARTVGLVSIKTRTDKPVANRVGLENTARVMLAPTTAICVRRGITKIKMARLVANNVLLANTKVEEDQRLPAAKVTVCVVTIAQLHQQLLKFKIVEPEIIAPQVPVVELVLEQIRELQ